MVRFSERKGLKRVSEVMQIDSMNAELRNSLWNALDFKLWSSPRYTLTPSGQPEIIQFGRLLWYDFFKLPMDTVPPLGYQVLEEIRKRFFSFEWYEVYDFVEFVVQQYPRRGIEDEINHVLQRELAGFRFVGRQLTDIVNELEIAELEEGINDTGFSPVSAHLKRAFELYSDRDNPDYRNSIKESISAVESMAIIVSGNPKASLKEALAMLERANGLHSALKEGFIKLYSYTSDTGGVRHGMLDAPSLSAPEARFFLLSCTSFVNYLKSSIDHG